MRKIKKLYVVSGLASHSDVVDKVHFYIERDGSILNCLPLSKYGKMFTNGNMSSIQVFLHGLHSVSPIANKGFIDYTSLQMESLYGLLYRYMNYFDLSYDHIVLFTDGIRTEFGRKYRNWFDLAFQNRLSEPLFYMPASFTNVNTENYV